VLSFLTLSAQSKKRQAGDELGGPADMKRYRQDMGTQNRMDSFYCFCLFACLFVCFVFGYVDDLVLIG
jgi:hypothetical protein